jgi:hypothetical protein
MSDGRGDSSFEHRTRVAHAGYTEHIYFDHLLFEDLASRESYSGMMALAVGGRRMTAQEASVLDDVAIILSVADPRIWPLKLTRLVASYGRWIAGVAAGNLCLEGAQIGHWLCGRAAENLVDLGDLIEAEKGRADAAERALETLLQREKSLVGFGVPFRPEDERVVALRKSLQRRGRHTMKHWSTLEAVSTVMMRDRGLPPNMCLGVAAACLDLGFQPAQIGALATALAQNVFIANAFESARQSRGDLRVFPPEHVEYVGTPPRVSPRASGR